MKSEKVIVIEDEADILEVIEYNLAREGYRVRSARDGEEGLRLVKKEIPDSRLIVVGPGSRLRRKYEREVIQSRLQDVVFVGYASRDDLPRYYKTADVFCAPATGWESFGMVLLEAMAVGKPVVASNIPGYANVVTHGVEGLLVPPKDEEELAQALISLVTDQSLRQQMGARGKTKAQEYGWEHIAQRLIDYYITRN